MSHNLLFPVVILAGGLATRLRPLTMEIPKPLIEINGEPFIAHQLRLLKKSGVKQIVLCLGHLGEMIVDYLRNIDSLGLQINYIFDGSQLLGTGGAIKQALGLLDENFFVLYGDSYLPCDYAAVQQAFIQSQMKGLMTVFCNHGQWDKSNVEFSKGQIIAYDKQKTTPQMKYIDYGLGIFNRKAFAWVPDNQSYDLACLYQTLLRENQLASFEMFDRFYETGSFVGINEFENYLTQAGKSHAICSAISK